MRSNVLILVVVIALVGVAVGTPLYILGKQKAELEGTIAELQAAQDALQQTIATQSDTISQLNTTIANLEAEPKPKGSVIEYDGRWVPNRQTDGYITFEITATVMNVGGDGTLTVGAEIITDDEALVYGSHQQFTQIYLRQGQEKTLHFNFWLDTWAPIDAPSKFSYRVWCPLLAPLSP